jgi:hypothetical protein
MSLCWWCCHDIGNSKIGVPTERVIRSRKPINGPTFTVPMVVDPPVTENVEKYELEGQMCSFECARAYIIDRKDYLYENKLQRLSHMRKLAFIKKGINFKDIPKLNPAPTWKTLKQFGGTLTIEEFRSSKDEWVIEDPCYIFNPPDVTKRKKYVKEETTWKEKQELINNSTNSSEQLKIKRSKPRVTATGFSDISSTLGIKVIVKD